MFTDSAIGESLTHAGQNGTVHQPGPLAELTDPLEIGPSRRDVGRGVTIAT